MADRIKSFRCLELERICSDRGISVCDLSLRSEVVHPPPENGSDEIHTYCYTGFRDIYYHGEIRVVTFEPVVLHGEEFTQITI